MTSRRSTRVAAWAGAASIAVGLASASPARADHVGTVNLDDPFDISEGNTVTNHSPEHPFNIVVEDMFGGQRGTFAPEVGHTIFQDVDTTHFVEFYRAAGGLPIVGVSLITQDDVAGGQDGFRGTRRFRLLADTDTDTPGFETVLVDANPTDEGTNDVYNFAATSAISFRAEFVGPGSRVIELDAIAIPEPAALSLLGLGGLALLARRRHR